MNQRFALEQKTGRLPTRRRGILAHVKEALFPPLCFGCKKELSPFGKKILCSACTLPLNPRWHTICPVCEKTKTFSHLVRCAHAPSPLSTVSYLFGFGQSTVRSLLHTLKYNFARHALTPFVPYLEKERLNLLRIPLDLIIPIPLHPRKERERGFNQAELIAAEVATLLAAPVHTKILTRPRSSPPQMKTRRREARLRNVQGLFRARQGDLLAGATVLLIDDIMTTGATLTEAAESLVAGGASRVHAFVLAREE